MNGALSKDACLELYPTVEFKLYFCKFSLGARSRVWRWFMNVSVSWLFKGVLLGFLGLNFGLPAFAQAPVAVPTSVNAGQVIDAAGPAQRKSLTAIYLIACPNVGFGS